MSEFHIVPGAVCKTTLENDLTGVGSHVRKTYRVHDLGATVNPDSYFLRFPDKPDSRVIALPAYLGGDVDRIGMKWISSFPGNLAHGIPRASAVLVLNDYDTGRPLACLESAHISAHRTGASAALAAETLGGPVARSVAVVGAGVIASTTLDHLAATNVDIPELMCHDLDGDRAERLLKDKRDRYGWPTRSVDLETALEADLVVFATTAGTPYVPAEHRFRPGQVVLNVSLRDLAPETVLEAANVVDDVDHCLKANTSPHLAEQITGKRDFIDGTLGGILNGRDDVTGDRPIIFSPFGLGVLDIAVGSFVLDRALKESTAIRIPEFFA
ncbi:2,3-diaminopropionate biosynthesis protein SbnB [Haloglycomyces albus]|uniref:2,3-diaminopropionate biosynthesis protein SbnB n=1 Tax=Haloglycomyces albus TaxID=526067 RepID=UPI0004A4DF8C|nr:2,3-diaminopropionate biosynthesis protein SbnB [Haloglycomyces albus]